MVPKILAQSTLKYKMNSVWLNLLCKSHWRKSNLYLIAKRPCHLSCQWAMKTFSMTRFWSHFHSIVTFATPYKYSPQEICSTSIQLFKVHANKSLIPVIHTILGSHFLPRISTRKPVELTSMVMAKKTYLKVTKSKKQFKSRNHPY